MASDPTARPERADEALEAAAMDIVMRLGAAAKEGLNMPSTDQVVAIMRRHGLRGPLPQGKYEPRNPTDDCCPDAGTRHCDCWEGARTTQEGEHER